MFSISSAMLSEIFMQINRILTKLHQLKLGGPVIMPHHVYMLQKICVKSLISWNVGLGLDLIIFIHHKNGR